MTPLKETIADPTDPGTLRPDLPPATKIGTKFEPMDHPSFAPKIDLPSYVLPGDAFALWSQFFSREQLQIIVDNTNAYEPCPNPKRPRNNGGRVWKDLEIGELYTYLAIWIYMGIHIECQIPDY